jgi:hypothetical protein
MEAGKMNARRLLVALCFAAASLTGLAEVLCQTPPGSPPPPPSRDEFDLGLSGAGAGAGAGIGCDQERCEGAGRTFLIAAAIVDVAAVLIGFLLWLLFTRKNWLTPLTSFLLIAFLAAGCAMVVIALNPFADAVWKCCIASGDLARYVALSDLAAWPRGAVVGAAPVFIVLFIVLVIKKAINK